MDRTSSDIAELQAQITALETIVLAMFKLHPDRQLILGNFRDWSTEKKLLNSKTLEGQVRIKMLALFEKQGF